MKNTLFLFAFLAHTMLFAQSTYPVYTGKDLGLTYSKSSSTFKIWSPTAESVTLRFYKEGVAKPNDNSDLLRSVTMQRGENGTWVHTQNQDCAGEFYTFQIKIGDKTYEEVPDPYVKSVGVNGKRAMVLDLNTSNPDQWAQDVSSTFLQKTDAILYELHVRDATSSPTSGVEEKYKGKFLGLRSPTPTLPEGQGGSPLSKGVIGHIQELGVTHVHLLPVFDYFSINETAPFDARKYNWGYDPLNYNVPEGSYSTNAYDGVTRIREFKQLVQAMHKAGLRVVMDVVYNHTMFGETSHLNQIAPGYYYRFNADGSWSNGSGCGNETASDKPMMQKFMLESLKYWVEEYHIDGFRFDLMGLHDISTMNLISKELHALKPSILLYGEGWTAGGTPLPENQRAVKSAVPQLDRIAAFSDDMRDALKGSVFEHTQQGFVSGKEGMEESVKFGILAATKNPQINYEKVNYSKASWTNAPSQCINYSACHDNHTLWDRLLNSNPNDDEATRLRMYRLAESIVLTSQGIPFLHAGTEICRSKKNVENSFESGDDINAIDWSNKIKYKTTFDYFCKLIALRKAHPAFRMATSAQIVDNLSFIDAGKGVIAYTLNGEKVGDTWKKIVVLFNSNRTISKITLPEGKWKCALDGDTFYKKGKKIKTKTLEVKGISTVILWE